MDKLLIHSTTEHMLADQLQSPSHAVLLVGPIGSGKTTLARNISMQLLGLADLANYPYYLELVSTDTRVGIDDIRSIRGFMKRTTTGSRAIRRVCLIDSVDDMTSEAANALLKMLEEPAEDTVFVLTAATQAKVPQTILSRVQQVSIHSVGEDMAVRHLKDKYAEADIKRAHAVSSGRPALMVAVLNDSSHPLVQAIAQAKELLTSDSYGRLSRVDEWAKDKQRTETLLFGLERIAQSLVTQSASAGVSNRLRRAHQTLAAVVRAEEANRASANPKLLLTDLFLNM